MALYTIFEFFVSVAGKMGYFPQLQAFQQNFVTSNVEQVATWTFPLLKDTHFTQIPLHTVFLFLLAQK